LGSRLSPTLTRQDGGRDHYLSPILVVLRFLGGGNPTPFAAIAAENARTRAAQEEQVEELQCAGERGKAHRDDMVKVVEDREQSQGDMLAVPQEVQWQIDAAKAEAAAAENEANDAERSPN
jgi:hypothetical protein